MVGRRQANALPDYEVEVFPPLLVGGAVCHIRFGGGEAEGVLVTASINSAPRVKSGGGFGKLQISVLVSNSAEKLVGMSEVLLEVFAGYRRYSFTHRLAVKQSTLFIDI